MRTFAQKKKPAQQAKSVISTSHQRNSSAQSHAVRTILHLQRTIGNHAVQRLLQNNTEELEGGSATSASTYFAHDFTQIPLYMKTHTKIQPKLTVSKPEDKYEQEADRVAAQVLQQEIAGEEEDHKVDIQTRASQKATKGEVQINEDLENHLNRSKQVGAPIAEGVLALFESRMKHDFSNVRVHNDNEAVQMNRHLSARAFTHGMHIYFGEGQYDPGSLKGKRLLAHELTHVVQQGASPGMIPQLLSHQTATIYRAVNYDVIDYLSRTDLPGGVGDIIAAERILLRLNDQDFVDTMDEVRNIGQLQYLLEQSRSVRDRYDQLHPPERDVEEREREEARALPGPVVEYVSTEPIELPGEDLIRRTAATVLAEAWGGQEEDIRWIYIDEENLQYSAAYSARSPGYRRWMVLLGDSRYRNSPVPERGDQWLIGRGTERRRARSIGEWADWYRRRYGPRALRVRELVIDMFQHPEQNPYAEWRGQVSLQDINRETSYMRRARQYFWLQTRGEVHEELLRVLLVPNRLGRTQFIFDAHRIQEYFRSERLSRHVPPIRIRDLSSILARHREDPLEYIRISHP